MNRWLLALLVLLALQCVPGAGMGQALAQTEAQAIAQCLANISIGTDTDGDVCRGPYGVDDGTPATGYYNFANSCSGIDPGDSGLYPAGYSVGTCGSGSTNFVFTSRCENGVDYENGACMPDDAQVCAAKPPLGETWVEGSTDPATVCSDGCVYERPTGAFGITHTVDGVQYFSVEGYGSPEGGQTCAVEDETSFATPPSDTDYDGVSDGLDAFPNDSNEWGDADGDGVGDHGDIDDDDADNGKDEGTGDETDNVSTGGGDCKTPPQSKGDALLVQIAYQTWATRCGYKGGSIGDGVVSEEDAGLSGSVSGDITNCSGSFSATGDPVQVAQAHATRATLCAMEGLSGGEADGTAVVAGDVISCSSSFTCTGGEHAECETLAAIRADYCASQARHAANDIDGNFIPDWLDELDDDIPTAEVIAGAADPGPNGTPDDVISELDVASLIGTGGDDSGFGFTASQCPLLDLPEFAFMGGVVSIPWVDICTALEILAGLILLAGHIQWAYIVAGIGNR